VRDLGDGFKVRRALPSAQRRAWLAPSSSSITSGRWYSAPGPAPNVRPHPHIGLSTLTYLLNGEMVHRDSAGNVEAIRAGDVNWMTAGSTTSDRDLCACRLPAPDLQTTGTAAAAPAS
jgi:redox-sensitive bicupin YhaK (pirin superfamily)